MSKTPSKKQERRPDPSAFPPEMREWVERIDAKIEDLEAWDELLEVARALDRPEELHVYFATKLAALRDSALLEEIGRRGADFCEEWFEDPAPTIEMLGAVLEKDPAQAWAFERLTVLLTATSRWDALLRAYDRAIERATERGERLRLREEAARVARDFAGDSVRGTDYLIDLFLERLDDDALLAILEKRLDEQGRGRDLVRVLLARLEAAKGPESQKLRASVARKYVELRDFEQALAMASKMLEETSDRRDRASDDALDVLGKIADAAPEVGVRAAALRAAIEVFAQRGEGAEQATAVLRLLALAPGTDEALRLHQLALDLLVRLGRESEALDHGTVLVEANPEKADLRREVLELARRIDRGDAYGDALVRGARRCEDSRVRVPLLVEAAELNRRVLGRETVAIDLHREVLRDGEAERAERLLATQELCSLLSESADGEELVQVWTERGRLEERPVDAAAAWLAAGRLSEARERFDDALEHYAECLRLAPRDLEALGRRIAILEGLSRPQGLVQALLDRASAEPGTVAERADLVRATRVFAEQLGDPGSAIKTWREVEKKFGRDEESFEALLALLERSGRFDEAVDTLREEIRDASNLRASLLQERLGEVLRLHLQNHSEAIDVYSMALASRPESEVARAGLRALLLLPDQAERAAEALARTLLSCGETSALIDLAEIRLAAQTSAAEREKILLEASKFARELGRFDEAHGFACRAFEIRPTATTEGLVRDLAEQIGGYERLARAYATALEGVDGGREVELRVELGRIRLGKLGDFEGAAEAFSAALARVPENVDLYFEYLTAALPAGRYSEAARAFFAFVSVGITEVLVERLETSLREYSALSALVEFERELARHSLPTAEASLLRRRFARCSAEDLGDVGAALRLLRDFSLSTRDRDALELFVAYERKRPSGSLVEGLLALARVREMDLSLVREAAAVVSESGEGSREFEEMVLEAEKLAAERFSAGGGEQALDDARFFLQRATGQHRASGARESEIELLVKHSELPYPDDERERLLLAAAECAMGLESDARAVELFERALARNPRQLAATELLAGLHEKAGRRDALIQLRRRQLLATDELSARLELRLVVDELLRSVEGSVELRNLLLVENLDERPGHEKSLALLDENLRGSERFEELCAIYEREGERLLADGARARACFEAAGRVAEECLFDEERLVRNFRLAARFGGGAYVLFRLGEVLRSRQEVREARAHLEKRLEIPRESDERASRRSATQLLASLLRESGDGDATIAVLEGELEHDPSDNVARGTLVEMLERGEHDQRLFEVLVAGVPFADDAAAKVLVLRNAAEVARRRLGASERAVPLLRSAIELDRDDKSLRLALADALRSLGDFEGARSELIPLLEEFGRRRTREKALIHLELARVAEGKGDLAEALAQAEAAAAIERTDAPILLMVGRLARKNGEFSRAEQAYRTLLLIVSRGAVPGGLPATEAVSESAILLELSRIAKSEGQEERASELLGSALDAATKEPEEALRLARALEETGEAQLILDALSERQTSAHGRHAAELLLTRARILEGQGSGEDAVFARLDAIESDPEDLAAIRSTWKRAVQHGMEETCASRFVRVAERVKDRAVAAELWMIVASHAEEFDLERARAYYLAASKTGERAKDVFVALERVLGVLGDAAGLDAARAAFVAAEESGIHPELRTRSLVALAGAAVDRGELTPAVEWAREALAAHADPALLVDSFAGVVARPRARADVVEVFLEASRAAGNEEAVLLALRRLVENEPSALEAIEEGLALARTKVDLKALGELLVARIEFARGRGDLAEVRDLLVERAVMANAAQEHTMAALLYRDAIPLFDADERVALELTYAELLHGTLGNVDLAIETYERVLAGGHVGREVFGPLLVLYRKAGRLERVEEKLLELSELVGDEDRAILSLERAELLALSGRDEEAESLLRELVAARPDLVRAGEVLVESLFRRGLSAEARELLVELWDEAKRAGAPERLAAFGMLFARLFGGEDRDEAVSLLRAGLPSTGGNRQLLLVLLGLYDERDDPADRADALERLLQIEGPAEARRLTFALAKLRDEAGDGYGVTRAFEIGAAKAPDDVELLQAFVDALRKEDDALRLVGALPLLAETTVDDVEKAALFAEAATLAETRLGEPERAAELFEKSFRSDSTNVDALRSAVELWTRLGNREKPLAAFVAALEGTDEMGEADILELRSAYLAREFADDRDQLRAAAADIERALGLFVSEEQAERMRRLEVELLLRLGREAVEGDEGGRVWTLRLADAYEALAEPSQALDVLRDHLHSGAPDVVIALRLAELARTMGAPADEALALSRALEAAPEQQRKGLVLRLIEVALAAGEPSMAREALDDAIGQAPRDPDLRAARRRLYIEIGETHALAESLRGDANAETEPALRSSLLVEAADLLRGAAALPEARELLERALEGAAEPFGVLFRLSEVCVEMGEVDAARELLEGAVDAHGKKKSPELSALQHGLARVARAAGDIEGMYAWLETALLTDRNNADVAAELAIAAQHDGRYEVAVKALQMVTLAKGGCSMSKPEAYYRQAEIAERQGDNKKALLLARRAATTDEGYPPAQVLVTRLGG